jgi:transcriptional regulator of acetoin/glycerol metabolism
MIPSTPAGRELVAMRLTNEDAFVAIVRAAYLSAPVSRFTDRAASAARALGIDRRTLFRWMKRYPQILKGEIE